MTTHSFHRTSDCRRAAYRNLPAAVLLTTVLFAGSLTACSGKTNLGEAYPDWDQVEAQNTASFDAQMTLLDEQLAKSDPFSTDASLDIVGVRYSLASFGEESLGAKNTITLRGNPPSLFTQQTDPGSGTTIDVLHIGGSGWDYLLLGGGYTSTAPTAWVRYPTLNSVSDNGGFSTTMCDIIGIGTMCDLRTAISQTAESPAGKTLRKSVKLSDDGAVFSQTEITLRSAIDSGLYPLPDDIVSALPDSMLSTLIPVNIWQDATGDLRKVEVNGIVTGVDSTPDLQVQLGFEIMGVATKADFPDVPANNLVTTLTMDELSSFLDNIKATS